MRGKIEGYWIPADEHPYLVLPLDSLAFAVALLGRLGRVSELYVRLLLFASFSRLFTDSPLHQLRLQGPALSSRRPLPRFGSALPRFLG